MTPHHKPKNVKLTTIARLRKQTSRLPMVGDPQMARDQKWHLASEIIYNNMPREQTLAMAA
jgi:hypothetical protein